MPLVADGRFVDVEAYTRHNEAFHNAMVALADNPTLLDAYQRLGVTGVMVSLLGDGSAAGEVVDDHLAIVDAYERGSVADVIELINRHNRNAKAATLRSIAGAGGEI